MLPQEIERIMKENDKYAKMFEDYDRTGKFPLEKIRRSFTLRRKTMDSLKLASEKSGKSMSALIDNLVEKAEE